MKNTLFALLLVSTLNPLFAAVIPETVCEDVVVSHIEAIHDSEAFIASLKTPGREIRAYDVTLLQKSLTTRFGSLKGLLEIYKDKDLNCNPKVLAKAIAAHDLSLMGKSIFADNELRRLVLGFSKFSRYRLTDLVAYYKKYTDSGMINDIQEEIVKEQAKLPEGIIMDPQHRDYDPNLYKLSDAAIKGTTSVVAGAARVWGFISDHLKWRSGRLNNNPEVNALVRSKLKPLDLVFETRKFTLSNLTIPGNFGHVGVWLGTKEELVALGIWDEEFFTPFRSFVEQGMNIVEIRKEGLNFQSIETFMNLDEFAITRIEGILDRATNVYEALSEQVDKKYDFKFNAHSLEKITCAEMIAFSYGNIKWPETKTLFQYSLRPDDLAVLTLDQESPAKFVLYLVGDKKGQYKNVPEKEWRKIFNTEKHLTAEERLDLEIEKILKKQKREQEEEERRQREQYMN